MVENNNNQTSIIIPAFNGSAHVEQSINSVLAQTYRNFEIIIINDGSTDNTEEKVKGIKDDRLKYIKQENKGASSARNRGIREAKGKYIAFLDADDYWSPSHLSDHITFLEKHPEYIMSFNRYITVENGKEELYKWKNLSGNIYPNLLFIENNIIGTPAVVVRSDILKKSGLFDEKMTLCEDLDLWRRISKLGKVHAISKPSTYVVLREGQFQPKRYLDGRYEYTKKAVEEDSKLKDRVLPSLLLEMWIIYLASGTPLENVSENMYKVSKDYPQVHKDLEKILGKADVKSWLSNQTKLVTMDTKKWDYKIKYGLKLLKSQGVITTITNLFAKLKDRIK